MLGTIKATVKQGDQWAETGIFEALDENGDPGELFTVPDKAYIYLMDKKANGTRKVKLSNQEEADDDGVINLTQVGNTFELDVSLPGAITAGLPVGTYYGDLKLEWAGGESSPWTPDIELDVTRKRRAVS